MNTQPHKKMEIILSKLAALNPELQDPSTVETLHEKMRVRADMAAQLLFWAGSNEMQDNKNIHITQIRVIIN